MFRPRGGSFHRREVYPNRRSLVCILGRSQGLAMGKEPIFIHRTIDAEGSTYALSVRTRERLRSERTAPLRITPRFFVRGDTSTFRVDRGSIRDQIVRALTGLSEAQLRRFGP